MEKIIDVSALTDQLKILLWDRSKTREEMAELAIGLIEEAGEEIIRCRNCKRCDGFHDPSVQDDEIGICRTDMMAVKANCFCNFGERRDSDG